MDPYPDGNCAIKWASLYGHTEVVKELLKDKWVANGHKSGQRTLKDKDVHFRLKW